MMSGNIKPIVKTVTKTPSTSPGEDLQVKLLKIAKVDYLRIYVGGPGGEAPFETVYHRPIGVHDLDSDKDWVCSTPAGVSSLLARADDPYKEETRNQRHKWMIAEAVSKKLITLKGQDNAMHYPSGKSRKDFLDVFHAEIKEEAKAMRKLRAAWRANDAKTRVGIEPPEPNTLVMLKAKIQASKDKEAKEELVFSEFMSDQKNKEEAEKKFPSTYKTMKGAYFDVPQKSVKWAKGLTRAELQGEIAKYLAVLSGRNVNAIGANIAKVLAVTKK
jgi:hypothetical protein